MLGALNSAITGMDAAEMGMDVIGNNIANVQTTAFKGGTVSFASVYADSVSILGGQAGNEEGKGVQVVSLDSVWEQGSLEQTMNPTDCGISGTGFFQVLETGGNTFYTRAGAFRFDANNNLTDPSGRMVQGYAWDATLTPPRPDITTIQDIQVPATTVAGTVTTSYSEAQIGSDGIVSALETLTDTSTVPSTVTASRVSFAQIALFDFPSNDGLSKRTGNLYEESITSGAPVAIVSGQPGAGRINNNHLEASNVNLAREFVALITTQKAFQANSRVISSSSDMLSEVINIIR